MSITALLGSLRARGVRLAAVGDKLRVDAPLGVLAEADRALLTAHKREVLALLRRLIPHCPDCGSTMHPSRLILDYGRAWWCNAPCGRIIWRQDPLIVKLPQGAEAVVHDIVERNGVVWVVTALGVVPLTEVTVLVPPLESIGYG